MKKILPAAVLAALAGVNGAQAVHVNSDGLGQVLLYPFYTTEDGQDTYINLVNTTNETKAVKVRVLESMNSQEVLDFNLYLSPQDHWSAVITADENGGTITSGDNSCTVPLAISNGDTIPFREFEYAADSVNGTERTGEGYVEVIEMAVLISGGTAATNWPLVAKHGANGVPANCGTLSAAWLPGGAWDLDSSDGTTLPTGGLYGYGVLINVDEGTDATYDAIALDDFSDGIVVHTDPGSLDPSLNNSTPVYAVIDGDTVVTGTADNGLDAVSATIMHDTIANDYVLEPSIAAGTDWVMTFPTKRDYVSVTPALDPFLVSWDAVTSSSCEEFNISYWNREEATPTAPPGENDFSPRPPGTPDVPFALCYEANVMTFNGSNVLSASTRSGTNFTVEYDNGWARMNFATAGRLPLVAGANSFNGLPVVGFAVQKYVNGSVNGLLSNYAGSVTHKATRSIFATPPPPPPVP